MVIAVLVGRLNSLSLGSKSLKCIASYQRATIKPKSAYRMKSNMMFEADTEFQTHLDVESKKLAPALNVKGNHKGASGKIAVIGGSIEYTGAPYFAAISALKVGADLVHVFCTKEAATPIKSYSPELIVHPLLDESGYEEVLQWLKRMDMILIGCGLGRAAETMQLVEKILDQVQKLRKPVILDGDALFLIKQKPNLLIGFESTVILTPNRMELARIVGVTNPVAITQEHILQKIKHNNWNKCVTVFCKAMNDEIYNNGKHVKLVNMGGSGRRCGGQGDILGGALAVFLNWCLNCEDLAVDTPFIACYAASKLTRQCNQLGFVEKGRSLTASDMIDQIHTVFDKHFELPIQDPKR